MNRFDRVLFTLVIALIIGLTSVVAANAAKGGNGGNGGGDGFVPVLVCHASPTGAGNSGPATSYELITVDNAGALNGHMQHPNDIIDPDGGVCPTIEPPVCTEDCEPPVCTEDCEPPVCEQDCEPPVEPTCETDPTLCPTEEPPVDTPPVDTPPVATPPVKAPPVLTPVVPSVPVPSAPADTL
jgi:hypothetical protein